MSGRVKVWTEERVEKLTRLYPKTRNKVIARRLGVTEAAVQCQAVRHGLRKHPKFVNTGRFRKGSVPFNKGRKMSDEVYAKTAPTMFRKGHSPWTTKWDGYESIRRDSHGCAYVHVRVSKGRFVLKHRLEWEKANGPIPKDMILVCRSGDTTDCRPENWELITRIENLRRNRAKRDVDSFSLKMSMRHHPELREVFEQNPELAELKVLSNQLNRILYETRKRRKKHP